MFFKKNFHRIFLLYHDSDISNSLIDIPTLKENIFEESKTEDENNKNITEQKLIDHPEIQEEWQEYIEEKWKVWAEKDRKQHRVHSAYVKLYSLYKMQQMSETYEMTLMFGYLTWRLHNGDQIKHHLLSSRIIISFDPDKGIVTVSPHQDGIRLSLEQDMLNPEERPEFHIIEYITDEIENIGDDIWHSDDLHRILKAWINSYPESHPYIDDIDHQVEVTEFPIVHFAPALIVRQRTERSIISLLTDIGESIRNGKTQIPEGILDMVREPDSQNKTLDDRPLLLNGDIAINQDLGEIYFPLPTNNEQKAIVEHLSNKNGVLVQGPPGTGKSHTIANLICHLLAKGERVLVTSHTGRALEVLRKKIPEEIAPLCVVATGEDIDSRLALEKSVQEISDRYNRWRGSSVYKSRIDNYITDLNNNRKEEARLLKELMAIRESETFKHSMINGIYSGTLKEIANRINEEDIIFDWLKEYPDISEVCKLSNDEAIQLVQLLRELSENEIKESMANYPNPSDISEPEIFLTMVNGEEQARKNLHNFSKITERPQFRMMINTPEIIRNDLFVCLQNLMNSSEVLMSHAEGWVKTIVIDVLSGRDKAIKDLLITSLCLLGKINEKSEDVFHFRITGLEGKDKYVIRANAVSLLNYLQNGGKINILTKFIRKEVKDNKYLLQNIRINGYLCDNVDYLIKLNDWFEVTENLEIIAEHWKTYRLHIFSVNHAAFFCFIAGFELDCSACLYAVISSLKPPFSFMERSFSIALAPFLLQRIPEPSIRWRTRFLQALSTTPLPMGKPSARYSS